MVDSLCVFGLSNRSEIDHLTALMQSRTVDAPIRGEEKTPEVIPLEPMLSSRQKEEHPKTPTIENGIENNLVLSQHVSQHVTLSVRELALLFYA